MKQEKSFGQESSLNCGSASPREGISGVSCLDVIALQYQGSKRSSLFPESVVGHAGEVIFPKRKHGTERNSFRDWLNNGHTDPDDSSDATESSGAVESSDASERIESVQTRFKFQRTRSNKRLSRRVPNHMPCVQPVSFQRIHEEGRLVLRLIEQDSFLHDKEPVKNLHTACSEVGIRESLPLSTSEMLEHLLPEGNIVTGQKAGQNSPLRLPLQALPPFLSSLTGVDDTFPEMHACVVCMCITGSTPTPSSGGQVGNFVPHSPMRKEQKKEMEGLPTK